MADENKNEKAEVAALRKRIADLEAFINGESADRQAQEKRLAEVTALANLSAEERTQRIADKQYTDGTPFRVGLKEFPSLRLKAHSVEEARGRYRALCGILSVDAGKVIEAVAA